MSVFDPNVDVEALHARIRFLEAEVSRKNDYIERLEIHITNLEDELDDDFDDFDDDWDDEDDDFDDDWEDDDEF